MSSFISQKAGEFSEVHAKISQSIIVYRLQMQHAKNTGGICVQCVIRTQMKTVSNNVQCSQSWNTQSV